MTDEELELLKSYERRVRGGFPIGEIKTELLNKGFTEEHANNFMSELSNLSANKGKERNTEFRMIISIGFIVLGVIQLSIAKSMIGIWFIISGVLKLVYDLFLNKKKD